MQENHLPFKHQMLILLFKNYLKISNFEKWFLLAKLFWPTVRKKFEFEVKSYSPFFLVASSPTVTYSPVELFAVKLHSQWQLWPLPVCSCISFLFESTSDILNNKILHTYHNLKFVKKSCKFLVTKNVQIYDFIKGFVPLVQ